MGALLPSTDLTTEALHESRLEDGRDCVLCLPERRAQPAVDPEGTAQPRISGAHRLDEGGRPVMALDGDGCADAPRSFGSLRSLRTITGESAVRLGDDGARPRGGTRYGAGYTYEAWSPSGIPTVQYSSRNAVHTTRNTSEYGSMSDVSVPMPVLLTYRWQ